MATGSLGPAEPYTHHFLSAVERVDGRRVVLEETYFYPEGGGQPADRGSIDGVPVRDVQTDDGEVVHELDHEPSFNPGDMVSGSIDERFRTYCMRAHTASHAFYGAGRELLDDLGYGGFGITPEKIRVDFETTTEIDDALLVELERLVNTVVWENRAVSWETLPRERAFEREDVAYNAKTAEGITDGEEVRLVEIADWDVAACGGTHVSATSEIGPVTVLDRSNPGEGMTRVTFAVGPTAIDRRARDREGALTAACRLDTTVSGLPAAVETVLDDRSTLRDERNRFRDRFVDAQLDALDPVSHGGRTWLVGAIDGLDANGLADRAQASVGSRADVVVLASGEGETVAVATDGQPPARDLVDRATDAFGGGGGGSDTVAQAGGLDATAAEICEQFP